MYFYHTFCCKCTVFNAVLFHWGMIYFTCPFMPFCHIWLHISGARYEINRLINQSINLSMCRIARDTLVYCRDAFSHLLIKLLACSRRTVSVYCQRCYTYSKHYTSTYNRIVYILCYNDEWYVLQGIVLCYRMKTNKHGSSIVHETTGVAVVLMQLSAAAATSYARLNTLRPRQNGRHFADDTCKSIFMNENAWI